MKSPSITTFGGLFSKSGSGCIIGLNHRLAGTTMSTQIKKLLQELKEGLVRIYGRQLKAVYLYGSYARGDNRKGSDVDVMIVLTRYQNYSHEIKRTSELIGRLSLDHEISISRIFMKEEQWLTADTPLLRNIRSQGQPA